MEILLFAISTHVDERLNYRWRVSLKNHHLGTGMTMRHTSGLDNHFPAVPSAQGRVALWFGLPDALAQRDVGQRRPSQERFVELCYLEASQPSRRSHHIFADVLPKLQRIATPCKAACHSSLLLNNHHLACVALRLRNPVMGEHGRISFSRSMILVSNQA